MAGGRVSAHKWAVVVGVIGVALGALSFQAYADFSGGDTDSLSLTTAVLTLDHTANLSIDATGVAPGDTVMRVITLEPGGTGDSDGIVMELDDEDPSPLFEDDTDNALQLAIDACDEPWDETLDAGVPIDYTCGGTTTPVLAEVPAASLGDDATDLDLDETPGAENYVRLSLHLPDDADASVENESVTLEFSFVLVARQPTVR